MNHANIHVLIRKTATHCSKEIDERASISLQELRQSYKRSFGTELLDDVKSETSGNFRKALLALIESRVEFRSRLLHEALSGAGTDIRKLIDVMAPMEADEVEEVKRVYKLKYESDLEQDVKDDTSGEEGKRRNFSLAH